MTSIMRIFLTLIAIAPGATMRIPAASVPTVAALTTCAFLSCTLPAAQAVTQPFDMETCVAQHEKSPSICITMRESARAAARNEARLARLAQCEQDLARIEENDGKVPDSVKPATASGSAALSAYCVGAPTYQLNGFGDPSLPFIYGKDSSVPGW